VCSGAGDPEPRRAFHEFAGRGNQDDGTTVGREHASDVFQCTPIVVDVFDNIQADNRIEPAGHLGKGLGLGHVGQGRMKIGPVVGEAFQRIQIQRVDVRRIVEFARDEFASQVPVPLPISSTRCPQCGRTTSPIQALKRGARDRRLSVWEPCSSALKRLSLIPKRTIAARAPTPSRQLIFLPSW